jgi:hypothetical protein
MTLDTTGLRRLVEHIRTSQDLTSRALKSVEHLNHPQLAPQPGHLATLNCLTAVAQESADATHSLASALAAIPLNAAGFDPQPDAAVAAGLRERLRRDARGITGELLGDASQSLDACHIACLYSATALARITAARPGSSARTAAATQAPTPTTAAEQPRLTEPQKAALRAIAAGGVKIYASGRNGPLRISAGRGVRITMPTYERLRSLGLVERDTSSGFHTGQKLYATDAGRTAIAAFAWPVPNSAPAAPPATRHH